MKVIRLKFPLLNYIPLGLLFACLAFAQQSQGRYLNQAPLGVAEPLSTVAVGPQRFIGVHGRRAVIMGYADKDLEVWAYPFQIVSGYHIGFVPAGSTTESDGRTLLRRVIYEPNVVTRIFVGPDYTVREKLFVPLDQPAAIVTYEIVSPHPVDIVVHFTPVLNLMWPASLGGQFTFWDQSASSYVMSEETHAVSAIIGSPNTIAHDGTVNGTVRASQQLAFTLHPAASPDGEGKAVIYVAQQQTAAQQPSVTIQSLVLNEKTLEAAAKTHYQELAEDGMQILTPDAEINSALAWAEIALDQAWVCNPQLGCGEVAGYGPSRNARRPQYAWFFGGDGLVAVNAMVAEGRYNRAREELEFIAKYQNAQTGMVWHELSQSAGYIDWSKYPFMFVHVDISFDYLRTIERYVSASGDMAFATEHWPSIAAAYRYCQSLIDSSDHLPHIPPEKEGSDEQDRPSDDLSLSSSWLTAADAFARLAELTHHLKEANEAFRIHEITRRAIASHYWDIQRGSWIDGHTSSGTPIADRMRPPSSLLLENVFPPAVEERMFEELASSTYQTDWGARELASNSAVYDPYSYGKGSVSALATSEVAATYWTAHRPDIAFSLWSSIIPWSQFDSLGHIHEVLAGNYFQEQVESVPEQTWSSAGLLTVGVRGLLGIEPKASSNMVAFSPHLPPEWNWVSVDNVRLSKSTLSFQLKQGIDSIELEVLNKGAAATLLFDPRVPRGSTLLKATVDGNDVPARLERFASDDHADVEFIVPPGITRCELRWAGGVSLIFNRPTPQIGDFSTGMKVRKTHFESGRLSIDADVYSARESTFQIRTPWKVVALEGASVTVLSDSLYKVTVVSPAAPSRPDGYAPAHLEFELGGGK